MKPNTFSPSIIVRDKVIWKWKTECSHATIKNVWKLKRAYYWDKEKWKQVQYMLTFPFFLKHELWDQIGGSTTNWDVFLLRLSDSRNTCKV